MKKILLLALLLIPACGLAQSNSTIRRTQDSIVTISWEGVDDKGEPTGSRCTGFQIGITYVVTARHCLPADSKIELYVEGKVARVLKTTDSLALVETDPLIRPVLQLRKGELEPGEEVTTLGFAMGGPLASFRRNFSNYEPLGSIKHVVLDGAISSGMSGGPMIDKEGKVVGINQATDATRAIGCPADEIRDFMK